jgi:hypothetical protein
VAEVEGASVASLHSWDSRGVMGFAEAAAMAACVWDSGLAHETWLASDQDAAASPHLTSHHMSCHQEAYMKVWHASSTTRERMVQVCALSKKLYS